MTTFRSDFSLGEKVLIDGDASIKATVTGFAFYGHGPMLQCCWFANGGHQESWIGEFRLTKTEASQ